MKQAEINDARQRLLHAALKRFAECGYAGTSVQDVVDDAKVTKPTLYYYFNSKAGLYQALTDWAQDERLRLIQEATAKGGKIREKLVEIVAALFEFVSRNRELNRLSFASAFAANGEVPDPNHCLQRGRRNFDFLHSLIRQAQAAGELDDTWGSEEVANGLYGAITINVLIHLVMPTHELDRPLAERVVRLFLEGAGVGGSKRKGDGR